MDILIITIPMKTQNQLTNNCLVSVIIPSFNRPKETLRAVKSVLSQDYPSIEIIVVDDNGAYSHESQETRKTLSDLISKKTINYVTHIDNLGGNAARNTGIMAAQGKYISFLDSDDEFLPQKISKQVEQLHLLTKSDPRIKAVTCNVKNYINGSLVSETSEESLIDNPYPILSLSLKMGAGSTILFDRECLAKTGDFDESLLRHQEVEFILRYLKHYSIQILPDTLVAIHMDDRSNIPKTKKFIENKTYFLSKVSESIDGLLPKEKKEIFMKHNLEISKVAIRNKNFFIAIMFLIKAKPNFSAFKQYLKEVFDGTKTYLLKIVS